MVNYYLFIFKKYSERRKNLEKGGREETLVLAHGYSIIGTTSEEAWVAAARGPYEVLGIVLNFLTTLLSSSAPTSSV